jgi:hypothetical protein
MFEFHRYSALLSAVAATVFAGLQIFEAVRPAATEGPAAPEA